MSRTLTPDEVAYIEAMVFFMLRQDKRQAMLALLQRPATISAE